jgi:hypothetical protein
MARRSKKEPLHPPRDARNEELGESTEERDRHLRYAHEQYTASGQGHFGAPKGNPLPAQKPPKNKGKYPPGARMPWPHDEAIDADPGSPELPPERLVGPTKEGS